MATVPFGATDQDLAEFMLGKVAVNVAFFESAGAIAPGYDESTEDWTPALIEETKAKIADGLQWWVDTLELQNSVHSLEFEVDWHYADNPVTTPQEPINRLSSDFTTWGSEFFEAVGFQNASASTFVDNLETYNHQQRIANNAHWAFTIFVANSENDEFDTWAPGGPFSRAFALPQEKLIVLPSGRPEGTVAHEVGHMFWALDEYQGGGSYDTTRGVYNTRNTNAWNNPDPNYVHQPSIMAGSAGVPGSSLEIAYANHTSSDSSLEIIGWRDSDGDGIFDILDVPHQLQGSGYYNSATSEYIFQGSAQVGTLPNLNPRPGESTAAGSLRNDMTINQITHVEYRVDNGDWVQLDTAYNSYQVALDLAIEVPNTFSQIELRVVDATTRSLDAQTGLPDFDTGVISNLFLGEASQPTSTAFSGVNGFVRYDLDRDGTLGPTETSGLAGWTVQIVDAMGAPLELEDGVEPDDYPTGTDVDTINPEVTLSAIGTGVDNHHVTTGAELQASTEWHVFRHYLTPTWSFSEWTQQDRRLRMDFTSPVATLSLDAISDSSAEYGRLEIFDNNDNLLGRYTTDALSSGTWETMTLSRDQGDIAYAIASGHGNTDVFLDNLRFGAASTTTTDDAGAYHLPYLPAGDYTVQVTPENGFVMTTPATQEVQVVSFQANIDFGAAIDGPATWTNPINQFDVDNNGEVELQDALLLINNIHNFGERELPIVQPGFVPPPFLDPTGDGRISLQDALAIVNDIHNSQPSGPGEGELLVGPAADSDGTAQTEPTVPDAEGESASFDANLQRHLIDDLVWGDPNQEFLAQNHLTKHAHLASCSLQPTLPEPPNELVDLFLPLLAKLRHANRL